MCVLDACNTLVHAWTFGGLKLFLLHNARSKKRAKFRETDESLDVGDCVSLLLTWRANLSSQECA